MLHNRAKHVGKHKTSLAYCRFPDGVVVIRNLDFAGYCAMKNLPIIDPQSTKGSRGSPRRYRYLFHDPENLVESFAISYLNSEAAKHADAVRRLKNMTSIVSDKSFEDSDVGGKSYIIHKD